MYQLTLGLNENIFRNPIKNYLGSSISINQLIEKCVDFFLKIPDTLRLILSRDKDGYLMQTFSQHMSKPVILEQMNICRIDLKLIFISDVYNADGTMIDNAILNKQPICSKYTWTNTPIPQTKLWNNLVYTH